jgi:hypothetical protein
MRRAVLAGVVVAAFALSAVHWLGLLVGGVAVGLLAGSLGRALAGGAGFGAVVWLGFLAVLANAGRLDGYMASGQLLCVSLAIPLVIGAVGALSHLLRTRERTA